MKIEFPKIGMRNIKTGCSVFLTLIISYVCGRSDPFFGCIAAIICLQQTKEKTWNVGLHRWIGTCIGGTVGFFVMEWLATFESFAILQLCIIPIGVCLLIYLCVTLKLTGAITICCIVFVNVVLHTDRSADDALIYVLNRVIDTTIGIICAGLVQQYLHLPKRWKEAQED